MQPVVRYVLLLALQQVQWYAWRAEPSARYSIPSGWLAMLRGIGVAELDRDAIHVDHGAVDAVDRHAHEYVVRVAHDT